MTRTVTSTGLMGLALLLAAGPGAGQGCAERHVQPSETLVSQRVLDELSAAVESYVDADQIVGAELVVWQDDRVLLDRAFGLKDREKGESMQVGTVFNVRSMTKTLLGMLGQMLVDEGRLSLDDQVVEFLPGFDRDGSREITVDQLLTHRSGLPLSVVKAVDDYPSLIDQGNAAGEAGPQFPPGSRFGYSDAGADALGAVIEAVERRPLAQVMSERLVEPLGLANTFPGSNAADPRWVRVAPLYARANGEWVRAWGPERGAFYPFLWGSQGMMSTPADFVRVVDLLMHGGHCGDAPLLGARAIGSMAEPVSRMTSLGSDAPEPTNFSGAQVRYGRLLEVRTPWPVRAPSPEAVIGHSGSDGTVVYAWPARGLAIAYFTQSRGNATHLRLERVIDRLILHPDRPVVSVSPGDVQDILGRYTADFGPFSGSEIGVVLQDGQVALELPSGVVSELRPPGEDGWEQVVLAPSVSVSFRERGVERGKSMGWRDPSGEHLLVRAAPSTEPEGAPVPEGIDLGEYVGWYRLEDVPNQPDIQLVKLGGDLAVVLPGAPTPLPFDGPDSEGYWALRANPQMRILFRRDAAGRVVSYAAIAPDGSRSVRVKVEHAGPGRGAAPGAG